MKQYLVAVINILCLASNGVVAESLQGYTFLSPRSQSTDAARELVGWRSFINLDECGWYTAFSAMGMYQHSFRAYRIAEYFFGSNTLSITGSQNEQRNTNEILADYFGLSPAFNSDFSFEPEIQNSILDLDWYLGYKKWYFRMHVPFVECVTKIHTQEQIYETDAATTPFPALYMDFNQVNAPATSFTQALTQQITYGQVTEGLRNGRLACKQKRHGVSDVQLALGYNFCASELEHWGFNFRLSIPTGNRSAAVYLFEPMIGNGKHWEVGLGFTGHWVLWEKDLDKSIGLYLDINATHLCKARQRRAFDFGVNCTPNEGYNFGSRYILAKEFDANGNYTGNTIPAINRTTLACKTWYNFELDLALMVAYSSCSVDLDFGYSPWIRSKEHIELCQALPENLLGLKGIQNVALAPGILSNATQSKTATLVGNLFSEQAAVVDVPSPQFVNTGSLKLASAAVPTAFTHKFFGNVSHAWKDYEHHSFTPFVGVGGEVEFESLNPRELTQPNKNSISQWAFWIKGGFTY